MWEGAWKLKKPLKLSVEIYIGYSQYVNSFQVPQKNKIKKLSRQAKPGISHSHTGAYSKLSIKRYMNPNKYCRTTSNSQDIQPAKPPPRLKLKQGVVHIYGRLFIHIYSRLFLIPKKPPLKLGNYDAGSHRDGP